MPGDSRKTKAQLLDEVQELQVCASSSLRMVSITLLILGLVGSGIPLASANEDVTLHLQWYHQFQFAGYYAAQEKGFFREEGLDVTIVEGGPGTENFKAVLSAPGNYGTAHASGLLAHRANGEPLVVLASIFQHSPNAIIARADRGIQNPHDLVPGRTVIWPGGHVELSAMLLSEGVSPAPFLHEVDGSHLQDLLDGKIDAIDGYVTNEALSIREAGVPIVIISPVTYGVDFYGDVLMTSERELREHHGRTKAFRAASLRGWEYAMEHPQEIVELIVSEYSAKPSRKHLLSEAEATKPLVLNPLVEIGHTNPGRWQRMADTLAALDMAKTGIQAEDFLFDPNPDTDLTKVYLGMGIAIAIATVIGVFAFVLLHFNRRLRREIFKRKQDEEKLRESEGRFRSLSDATFEGIAITHEGRIVDANGTFIEMFGYGLEELVGQEAQMLVAPEDRELVMTRNRSGYEKPYEHKALHRDGSIITVEAHGRALLYRGRQCRLTAIHNITERKQAEEIIRSERLRLFAVLEQIPAFVYLQAPDYSIRFANRYYREHFGDTEGVPCHKSLWGRDEPCEVCPTFRVFDTAAPQIWEWTETPDGRAYQVYDYPFTDTDGSSLVLELGIDITERKQAEEERRNLEAQMQQTQKLESLGVMAGGIAHDFNNILYAILGNADIALDVMPPEAVGRDCLQEIKTAARRASGLTDQMLAYSGKGALAIEKMDLSGLVQEMAHLLEVSHTKKAIVKYRFEENLPAIEGDASQLRQVVMNLITNASEAEGDEGGIITVTTAVTEATQEYLAATYAHDELPRGRYVYLEITDTGCGMDKEAQRRIFEPFFTTKFTGRGLGMAAVLGIVRAHKGAIDIQSEVDQGTTVKVLFPALDEPAKPPSMEAPREEEWTGHGTVLVVDDEPQIRKLTKIVLERRGFTVLTAEDGCQATDLFKKHKDDIVCVLLDLTMPHMGGEETFVELHQIRDDVPVVLVSGYSEEQLKERVEDLGFAGFLKKPVQSRMLLDKVRTVLKLTEEM